METFGNNSVLPRLKKTRWNVCLQRCYLLHIMYQSNWSFKISPGNPPGIWAFEDWLAPPISTEIPLLKDKFRLQSNTVHAFQSEICHNDTFKLLLKTLSKELFPNNGEILSWKSVKPCKNRKNARAYYSRTRDKSGSNSPPFQVNVQILPSPGKSHSQMPWFAWGGGGGGCWSFNLTGTLPLVEDGTEMFENV